MKIGHLDFIDLIMTSLKNVIYYKVVTIVGVSTLSAIAQQAFA